MSAIQPEPGPYFLTTDNDGHWYVIPVARSDHWDACALQNFEGEEGCGEIPDYADPVGGSPGLVRFDHYISV